MKLLPLLLIALIGLGGCALDPPPCTIDSTGHVAVNQMYCTVLTTTGSTR